MNLTKSHRAYFAAAKAMSELSDNKQVKIGAVVVYKHRIISSGCNITKGNPVQKKLNRLRFSDECSHPVHAEVHALLPLLHNKDIDFKRVSIYVYREYKNGELGMSRPCPSCEQLIRSLGIRRIYYTGNGSYVYEELIY